MLVLAAFALIGLFGFSFSGAFLTITTTFGPHTLYDYHHDTLCFRFRSHLFHFPYLSFYVFGAFVKRGYPPYGLAIPFISLLPELPVSLALRSPSSS